MTNAHRGTAWFNILLGFPEPKVQAPPPPLEEMTEWPFINDNLVKAVDLWLDGKTFTITYWPRPDTPFYHSYDNAKMRAKGCKFFDFRIRAELDETPWLFSSHYIWYPTRFGTVEMLILDLVLANAYYWRNYSLEDFAKSYGEDAANDYIELRWNCASRCDQYLSKRLLMTTERQDEMFYDLRRMREQEGVVVP